MDITHNIYVIQRHKYEMNYKGLDGHIWAKYMETDKKYTISRGYFKTIYKVPYPCF